MTAPLPARKSSVVRDPTTSYPIDQIDEGLLVLEALASLRFATAAQVRRIIFDRSSPTARQARHRATRSLRRLFDAGYLRRVPVLAPSAATGRLSRQLVHVLSASGARAVGVDLRWARRRAPREGEVLGHDFWLVELAVTIMAGCPEGLGISTWWDDRMLAGRKRRGQLSLSSVPDALLVVEHLATGKPYPFLVELDLGSESVAARTHDRRDFARKIEGYLDYLGSAFRHDFDLPAPAVVLIVAESERRLHSLRTTTHQLGGRGRFWFSTLARLRDQAASSDAPLPYSAARQGPFWEQNWQTAQDDGWRSVAARCGV
jgi:hypothetical protein